MLQVGSYIEWNGEQVQIGAVGILEGERYYWLVSSDNSVSMMPAAVVEPALESVAVEARKSERKDENRQG